VHPVEGYLGGVGIVEPILDVGDMRSYSRATAGLHPQRGQQRGYVRRVLRLRDGQAVTVDGGAGTVELGR
jgi:hypothetical protein